MLEEDRRSIIIMGIRTQAIMSKIKTAYNCKLRDELRSFIHTMLRQICIQAILCYYALLLPRRKEVEIFRLTSRILDSIYLEGFLYCFIHPSLRLVLLARPDFEIHNF